MTTLVDGLGGEELGDSVDSGSKTSTLWITGSITTESQISGLNVFATGSAVAGRINNADGALFPANVGSPASYGGFIQMGTVTTGAGSEGTIEFGKQFSNTDWYCTLTAGSDISDKSPYISGARNVSGATIVGEASITYNYLAGGL